MSMSERRIGIMTQPGRQLFVSALLTASFLYLPALAQDRPDMFGIGTASGGWTLLNPPGYEEAMWDAIEHANAHSTRIGASWPDIQPQQAGPYQWDELDATVALCLAHNIRPYCLIVNTPAWASPTGQQTHAWPPQEQYAQDFINFCTTLASRYAGQIDHWEFWNEQNGYGWHEFNRADEYVPWLRRAYNALKAGNPNCVVGLGGMDDPDIEPGDQTGWRGAYYLNLVYYYRDLWYPGEEIFDAIGDHPYCRKNVFEDLPAKLRAIRNVLTANGDGHKPFWLTEYGWSTAETGWTHEKQAQYLNDYLTVLTDPAYSDFNQYVIAAQYLAISDFETGREGFGLCDQNLRTKPAYYVFQSFPQANRPQISHVQWKPLDSQTVQISWQTNIASSSRVDYGLTPQYTNKASSSSPPATQHIVLVNGLRPGTEYHFRVVSGTPIGGTAASPDYVLRCADLTVPYGGFEGGFGAGFGKWWSTWGRPACTDGKPLGFVHEGDHSQAAVIIGNWNSSYYDFGLLTQVAIAPGRDYAFSAWVQLRAGGSTLFKATIGTDPTGGTDPTSPDVVWSPPNTVKNLWRQITVSSTATEPIVTVFVRGQVVPPVENVYYWFYLDDAELTADDTHRSADFDGDSDVDVDDCGIFNACSTGPNVLYDPISLPPGCPLTPNSLNTILADMDADFDVDQTDFGLFQCCFSGPGNHPDPGCW